MKGQRQFMIDVVWFEHVLDNYLQENPIPRNRAFNINFKEDNDAVQYMRKQVKLKYCNDDPKFAISETRDALRNYLKKKGENGFYIG